MTRGAGVSRLANGGLSAGDAFNIGGKKVGGDLDDLRIGGINDELSGGVLRDERKGFRRGSGGDGEGRRAAAGGKKENEREGRLERGALHRWIFLTGGSDCKWVRVVICGRRASAALVAFEQRGWEGDYAWDLVEVYVKSIAWISAVVALVLARPSLGDLLVMGNDSSELGHALVAEFSEAVTGALGQKARTLLPRGGGGEWEGGKVAFRVAGGSGTAELCGRRNSGAARSMRIT